MKIRAADANPRYQALLQLLRTADTIWNASRVFFERWQLGPSQFNVLNLLLATPGGFSQSELSRQLIMHRSNLTGLVDRLEKRRLLERKDVAADRRAYRVVLTEAGRKLLLEILPRYYAGAGQVWGQLPSKRVSELLADLQEAARRAERLASQEPRKRTIPKRFIERGRWSRLAREE